MKVKKPGLFFGFYDPRDFGRAFSHFSLYLKKEIVGKIIRR